MRSGPIARETRALQAGVPTSDRDRDRDRARIRSRSRSRSRDRGRYRFRGRDRGRYRFRGRDRFRSPTGTRRQGAHRECRVRDCAGTTLRPRDACRTIALPGTPREGRPGAALPAQMEAAGARAAWSQTFPLPTQLLHDPVGVIGELQLETGANAWCCHGYSRTGISLQHRNRADVPQRHGGTETSPRNQRRDAESSQGKTADNASVCSMWRHGMGARYATLCAAHNIGAGHSSRVL